MSNKNSKNITFIILLILLIAFALGYETLRGRYDTPPMYTRVNGSR